MKPVRAGEIIGRWWSEPKVHGTPASAISTGFSPVRAADGGFSVTPLEFIGVWETKAGVALGFRLAAPLPIVFAGLRPFPAA